jgi:hypothetical protein
VSQGGGRLQDLVSLSPVNLTAGHRPVSEWLTQLFPQESLICLARMNAAHAQVRPLVTWCGSPVLDQFELIVPSPMTSLQGLNQQGKLTNRCLNNTASRRYLVIEFDNGDQDSQVARLIHLADYGPLALVLHSGGKSVHGWFRAEGIEEGQLREFFSYAVRLGADPMLWVRCQMVRLPDGYRTGTQKCQRVYFFDPEMLPPSS